MMGKVCLRVYDSKANSLAQAVQEHARDFPTGIPLEQRWLTHPRHLRHLRHPSRRRNLLKDWGGDGAGRW